MSNTISVEYTQEDVNSLVALIDAGVKALGLQGAKAAAHHFDKLEQAAKSQQAVETEEGHA